jgi:hypothetical protein
MNIYHPIRMEQIGTLIKKREEVNAAALQTKMLDMLTKKFVGSRQLAADKSHVKQQRQEEQFDADSEAPWRSDIKARIVEALSTFGERGRNIFDMTLVDRALDNGIAVRDDVLKDYPELNQTVRSDPREAIMSRVRNATETGLEGAVTPQAAVHEVRGFAPGGR